MSPSRQLMTADELLHAQIPDKRTELVNGVLVVREPAAAETGFVLARGPDTVRAPDIAFVGRARLPDPEPTGFPDLVPDLVVEVLSPDDRPGQVLAKVADWLNGGARLVWAIDPGRRIAPVYRSDGTESTVTAADALDGEDVLPGFSCPLESIL